MIVLRAYARLSILRAFAFNHESTDPSAPSVCSVVKFFESAASGASLRIAPNSAP